MATRLGFFQVEVSSFHQYNGIASNAVPLVLALFLGSWSDRRGRKLPLLLGLLGQTYYFAMLTLVSTQGEACLCVARSSECTQIACDCFRGCFEKGMISIAFAFHSSDLFPCMSLRTLLLQQRGGWSRCWH